MAAVRVLREGAKNLPQGGPAWVETVGRKRNRIAATKILRLAIKTYPSLRSKGIIKRAVYHNSGENEWIFLYFGLPAHLKIDDFNIL
jgi:hypothetical protein